MSRNNTIGIVGTIVVPPYLIINSNTPENKIYETKIKRTRPSGVMDEYTVQFPLAAAGAEEILQRMQEQTEVLIGGEIHTKNLYDLPQKERRTQIYIYAEVIAVNEPPAEQQNDVKISGIICSAPFVKKVHRQTGKGCKTAEEIAMTSIVVAVGRGRKYYYIPCTCWRKEAAIAAKLKAGSAVEITGRFLSRQYTKRFEKDEVPYLVSTYEISVTEILVKREEKVEHEDQK